MHESYCSDNGITGLFQRICWLAKML
uniref:Uncharacterized protein n=1 Tax=Arundo donax TaxID=35708 RepID=A0A0A9ASX2_ARUDO